jgi:ubiquinone/menaquinone biosynthesis C-methylase UbiE
MNAPNPRWWADFFGSEDSLTLSNFPDDRETEREVAGLHWMLDLPAGSRVLDVCCGMGRQLVRLARDGFDMFGVDASEMMVRMARDAAREFGVSGPVVRGDAAALPFASGAFDAVTNLFNSFGYLPTVEDDARVLSEAARCLKPGGRFILDTRNSKYQILYAPYHQVTHLADGREAIMRCRWDGQTRRLVSTWYDAKQSDKILHQAAIRLYRIEELETMLAEAGFAKLVWLGGYDCHEFEGYERQLIYVGEKV